MLLGVFILRNFQERETTSFPERVTIPSFGTAAIISAAATAFGLFYARRGPSPTQTGVFCTLDPGGGGADASMERQKSALHA